MIRKLRQFYRGVDIRLAYYIRYIKWLGLVRGIRFIASSRRGGKLVRLSIPGIAAPVHLRCRSSDITVLEDTFVRGHYGFSLSANPNVIIDAGAHIGLVSVLFANLYPKCRIISIEPEVSNFRLLCKNTREYENITAVNAPLWFENTALNINDPNVDNWAYRFSSNGGGEINSVTIPQIMNDFDLSHIDLLKMDIEGAEKEVMENSQGWIDSVGTVVIELHDRFREGCSRAFRDAVRRFPYEVVIGPNIVVSTLEIKLND